MGKDHQLTRRNLLATSVAAAGASMLSTSHAAPSTFGADDAPWIDAHSHIWTPDTSVFRLAPGMTVDDLQPKSFTDDELMAIAGPEGVGRVVLIQHTPFHGFDNSYLIDAWKRHPDRFRVVGMVDDLRPKAGVAMKQFLKQGVTGFRILPRKGIAAWLETDGMTDMWKTAAETRQSMCCLINPENLPEVDAACRRHPGTPVVIDHFARIGIDGTVHDKDLTALCALAKHPEVKVKISAYYALGAKQPPHHELIPMIKRLYETFGANRLMWASDCPYQLDGQNNYSASIGLIRDVIDFVSDEERRQLLRTTAEQTFFFV
ncbi:MAG: amidohydrolase family protein [Planctomycetaceae bacterium]